MKLIIAEKPSLAKNIMKAIPETFEKKEGYYQGQTYIISYAFGHLYGLYDLDEYNRETWENNKAPKWNLDVLPYYPEKFKFKLKDDGGVRKQFKVLKGLINSDSVEQIIHCGDADREGEVIVRLIIIFAAKREKPVYRLWLPEQTEKNIRDQLANMKPDKAYDNLFNEGLVRTYVDWLYGINLTRYATIKAGSLLRVGRVLTPIVKAIYDRHLHRASFVPVKSWKAESRALHGENEIILTSKAKFEYAALKQAEEYCDGLNANATLVSNKEVKQIKKQAPKLFSLSNLQGALGKRYKMSPAESMEIIQRLYESGYITYPRTNTEYLAQNEMGKIEDVLRRFTEQGHKVIQKKSKRIYDDSKIESHSALTPTIKLPATGTLTEKERMVYQTIVQRFLAVFALEECIIEETIYDITLKDEIIKLKGNVIKQQGYMMYEPKAKDKALPALQVGERLQTNFCPYEMETQPLKLYTVETLNNYLKSPLKASIKAAENEIYRDILEGVEIGTEATRTAIIENAIKNKYITLKNNTYEIGPLGIYYIELLQSLEIDLSVDTTVAISKMLKKVYNLKMTNDEVLKEIAITLKDNFKGRDIKVKQVDREKSKMIVGKCLKCGSDVVKTQAGYFCEEQSCDFALFPKMRYFSNEIMLNDSKVKSLLGKKRTAVFKLKNKAGKEYTANMRIVLNGKYSNFQLDSYTK